MFTCFLNNFELSRKLYLQENHRCPREVFSLARTLVTINTPIFADRVSADVNRSSGFPVQVRGFEGDDAEVEWIIDDIRSDRAERGHGWGDIALLYRRHSIGEGSRQLFSMPVFLAGWHTGALWPRIRWLRTSSRRSG